MPRTDLIKNLKDLRCAIEENGVFGAQEGLQLIDILLDEMELETVTDTGKAPEDPDTDKTTVEHQPV